MRLKLSLIISSLLLVGCATNATVSPSQNNSLNTVSPNTASTSKGGTMQNSLESWLKEDWIPNSTARESSTSSSTLEGTSAASASTDTTVVTDEKPFTLQSYADKWKVYHENKEKMNEGKPKEASHIDAVNALPVIGK
ncbi:MAG: hypothetical protein Q8M39_10910 [Sulfuricurvum sp.]|nr:hypothetical protein [Sulfuricurvum sp.]